MSGCYTCERKQRTCRVCLEGEVDAVTRHAVRLQKERDHWKNAALTLIAAQLNGTLHGDTLSTTVELDSSSDTD